jgi:hypothetical protein
MALQLSNSVALQKESPQAYEAVVQLKNAVNQTAQILGADATGPAQTPTNNGSLAVSQSGGIYDVAITDPSAERGEQYFIEWSNGASFSQAYVISLGPSRNWRGYLGNIGTTYWRFYKQTPGSNASPWINFGGTTPAPVGGDSSSGGPAPGAANGSGTGGSGQGYGPIGPIGS